jgi:hypothetical protein
MQFQNDQDWEYLDRIIALADTINILANKVKDRSDDPDVLHKQLQIESAALIIEKTSREYRPRLRALKALEVEINKPTGAGGLTGEQALQKTS